MDSHRRRLFNLSDFCHIWIEKRIIKKDIHYGPLPTDYGTFYENAYFIMGEWRHNGEEVVLTIDWSSREKLESFMNEKLGVLSSIKKEE